jgi:hypothetical protein
MNNDMNDEELAEMTETALISLMKSIISKEGIEMALNILKEVIKRYISFTFKAIIDIFFRFHYLIIGTRDKTSHF